jgi:TfoX/Sxy family transcriptional regulator of competence genes
MSSLMGNDQDFIDYVIDQVDAGVTYRHMFGGTTLYMNSKVVALICDNQLCVVTENELPAPRPKKKPKKKGSS